MTDSESSFAIPNRKKLLAQYAKAQHFGKIILTLEILLSLCLVFYIDFTILKNEEAIILLAVSILPTVLSLAYLYVQNKKKISDLKPTTKYGHLNKDDIKEVCDFVCNKMKINPSEVNFYVTGEKQINASALTLGFGYLIKSLQVVMLNRATLHALKKEELASVVAHELAHIYRYPLIMQQALVIRLFSTTLISLGLFCVFPSFYLIAIISGLYQGLIATWLGRYSIVIEFLCDDCGAEIAGVQPALRAEFLIAKHSEALSDALYYLLKAKKDGQILGSKDLAKLLEQSLSYDCVSSEELTLAVDANLKKHKEKVESNFFMYFFSLISNDSIETEQDFVSDLKKLESARKRETLELPIGSELNLDWFKELVRRVKEKPNTPIFRTPEDYDDIGSSHPGPRRRILYLWQEFVEKA